MDISGINSEAQQSFRSPPRRRRSTFFEKRDSIVPQPLLDNIEPDVCKKQNEIDEKQNHELMRYHDNLLAEKNQWKAEVKYRRNKYHDLRQQYQIMSKSQSRSKLSYGALSSEDIEFLKGKINTSQLVERQSNLHKSVRHTRELYRRMVELDNEVLHHCEEKVNKFVNYIMENSTEGLNN